MTDRERLCCIGGEWRRGGGGTVPAFNPATGEVFAEIIQADRSDVDRAVETAWRAQPAWARTSPFERAAVCEAIADKIRSHRDALASALTEDQGKPLYRESYDEVDEVALYFEMAGEDARRLEGALPYSTSADRRVALLRVPLGVVGVVTPWNWPYMTGAQMIAPALAAGNAACWVPAPTTSACSGLLAEMISEMAPTGIFSFLPGQGPVAGDALVSHPQVTGVGFIGSVTTGMQVSVRAAGKAQLLELGGNGPMVVLEDADLELAATAALEAAFLCAGQSCTAGERFLVQSGVRAEFVERVVTLTRARVRLGDPLEKETTIGPLNNEPTAGKFERHVVDARDRGARVCHGGRRATGWPTDLFVEPTVLDGVQPDMAIATEETFGPVVPVIEVASAREALEITNSSPFGLTAAVFTEDIECGLAFAEAARAGCVNVNSSTNHWETHLPFGGRAGSASGIGRVGGAFALQHFTELKTVIYPAPVLTDDRP